MAKLEELDLYAQIQVKNDQLLALLPFLSRTPTKILIDHAGRPEVTAGLKQPALQALMSLANQQRTFVKLSGLSKFSSETYPYQDGHPYLQALLCAFGAEKGMWGSDGPFLRATERMDIATQLCLIEQLIPDDQQLRQILWDTPKRVLGFMENLF